MVGVSLALTTATASDAQFDGGGGGWLLGRARLRNPDTGGPVRNINNVRVHRGSVYVRLDARTLEVRQVVRTGPVLDSPMCRFAAAASSQSSQSQQHQQQPREECVYSRRKTLQANYNKALFCL